MYLLSTTALNQKSRLQVHISAKQMVPKFEFYCSIGILSEVILYPDWRDFIQKGFTQNGYYEKKFCTQKGFWDKRFWD